MCIIIAKPKGLVLSKRTMKNSWENNDDGAGFVYARDGKLVIVKELDSFRKFWKTYRRHGLDHENVLLHFRILSSGKHDINNVHPFLIDDNQALVHNGVLSCVKVPVGSDINDTQIFIDEFMRCMVDAGTGGPVDWVGNELAKEYAEAVIGKWNKMAVINSAGEFAIWNEAEGHWKDECWFSNYSYNYERYIYPKASTVGSSYGSGSFGGKGVSYEDKWLEDWERGRFNNVESKKSQTTFLTDALSEKMRFPDSEITDTDEDNNITVNQQRCLQCGVLLSKSELQYGTGCCQECWETATEGMCG